MSIYSIGLKEQAGRERMAESVSSSAAKASLNPRFPALSNGRDMRRRADSEANSPWHDRGSGDNVLATQGNAPFSTGPAFGATGDEHPRTPQQSNRFESLSSRSPHSQTAFGSGGRGSKSSEVRDAGAVGDAESPWMAASGVHSVAGMTAATSHAAHVFSEDDLDSAQTARSVATSKSKSKWLSLAGKVLRFFGYYLEHIPEGVRPAEDRLHRVTLLYYLVDDTVQAQVEEHANSGLVGGNWYKRSKLMNPLSSPPRFLSYEDLFVGAEVVVHGQRVHICDCDAFTRSFVPYDMMPAQPYPTEQKTTQHVDIPVSPRVEEAIRLRQPKGTPETLVLEYAGEVLNPHTQDGTPGVPRRQPVTDVKVFVYPEDDTVEVKQAVGQARRGRQTYSQLFRRCRVPRNPAATNESVDSIGARNLSGIEVVDLMLSVQDFLVGNVLDLQGRQVRLLSCSSATREWWAHRGVDQASPVRPSALAASRKNTPTPSELAKLQKGQNKIDRRRLFHKQTTEANKVLVLEAVDHGVTSKIGQSYTIHYYQEDESMMIFVTSPPNTGGPSGVFLKRTRHVNPTTGRAFQASDLAVGSVIKLHKATLEITTLHTQDGEQASLGAVLLGLLTRIHSHHGRAPKLNGELEEQGRAPRGAEAMETELVEGPDQIRSMVEMLFPAIKCSMHESDCIFRFLRHSGQGIETRVTATSVRDLLSSAHAHKAIVGVSREEGFQPGELEAFVTYVCRFVTDTSSQRPLRKCTREILAYHYDEGRRQGGYPALFQAFDGPVVPLADFKHALQKSLHVTEAELDTMNRCLLPEGCGVVNSLKVFEFAKTYDRFLQTGRSIAAQSDMLVSSPPVVSVHSRQLLPQPMGFVPRVALVEFDCPGGPTLNPDKNRAGVRYDSIPIANGLIQAGVGCEIIKYSPIRHAEFSTRCATDFDGVLMRIQRDSLFGQRTEFGCAQEKLDELLQDLAAKGKVVWPRAVVRRKLESPLVQVSMNQMRCGLEDSRAYSTREEMCEGFKTSCAAGPRIVRSVVDRTDGWICCLADETARPPQGVLQDDHTLKLIHLRDGRMEHHTVKEFLHFCDQGAGGEAGEWKTDSPGEYFRCATDASRGQVVDTKWIPAMMEESTRLLMVSNRPVQIIRRKHSGAGGVSALDDFSDAGCTYHDPEDPEFAQLTSQFVDCDLPFLSKALEIQQAGWPLLWSASFVLDSENGAGDARHVLTDMQCECTGLDHFLAARGASASLKDVPDDKFGEGQAICNIMGEIASTSFP